jgi:hypothetical protein
MASVHSSRTCLPNLDHFNLNKTDVLTNGTNFTSTESPTLQEVTKNRIPRSLKTTVAAAQSKALQAILLAYIFRHTDTQAAILHKFISSISTSKS